jgi:hypothetical protein
VLYKTDYCGDFERDTNKWEKWEAKLKGSLNPKRDMAERFSYREWCMDVGRWDYSQCEWCWYMKESEYGKEVECRVNKKVMWKSKD